MKKIFTIGIVLLVVLGFGFFLFKISPEPIPVSSYNASLDVSGSKPKLSEPPLFNPLVDHYMGNPEAKNVFIEYGDLQCPACAAYAPILRQVPAEFEDTVFVFRHFPLVQVHVHAVQSAVAAEAAGNQGKFWEMEELLFTKQKDWSIQADPLETFAEYAREAGVADIEQFKKDITDKKYLPSVQKGSDEALGLNLGSTPSLFFNGHKLEPGDLPGLKSQAEQYLVK